MSELRVRVASLYGARFFVRPYKILAFDDAAYARVREAR